MIRPGGLIRAGGVVRQPRPGEGPAPRNVEERRSNDRRTEETVPVGEATAAALKRGPRIRQTQPSLSFPNMNISPCLTSTNRRAGRPKRHSLRRRPSKASVRRSWPLAGWNGPMPSRFLALARKYPQDPVAIDALGGLVASRFTPPEAEQAAEILIRDHIKNDKLIPLYRQLGRHLQPWSTAAERLLRAGAKTARRPTHAARHA